jgi:hypothetical protein
MLLFPTCEPCGLKRTLMLSVVVILGYAKLPAAEIPKTIVLFHPTRDGTFESVFLGPVWEVLPSHPISQNASLLSDAIGPAIAKKQVQQRCDSL